jgi:hypothetical protein
MAQLVAVLGMLGSAHDGEVLNAARLAERFRKQLNLTWPELFAGERNDALTAEHDRERARAERAEQRADKAEASVLGLAELVSQLRAQLAAARSTVVPTAEPPPRQPQRDGYEFTEPPPTDAAIKLPPQLAEKLLRTMSSWVTRGDILRIAPMLTLGIELPLWALARQHGMRLVSRNTRGGQELFRFER